MASILKQKNAALTLEERLAHQRHQWLPHCGAKQRARNLRRLLAETLREQRDGCDWVTEKQTLSAPPTAEERT